MQVGAVPLEELGAGLVDSRTGIDQKVAVGQYRSRSVGAIQPASKLLRRSPFAGRDRVNRVVGSRADGEDGSIRKQRRRSKLARRSVDQVHHCVSRWSSPRAGSRVIDLKSLGAAA